MIAGAAGAVLALLACTAAAKPAEDRAIAQLEAAYANTAKLAAGPARTQQACADADAIRTAAKGLPSSAPAGAAIDADTWSSATSDAQLDTKDLLSACSAPDHKIQLLGNKSRSADEIVVDVDKSVHHVLDVARPRSIPSTMKSFWTAFHQLPTSQKRMCAAQPKLAKLTAAFATPPVGADATQWQDAHAKLAATIDGIKATACASAAAAPEDLAGATSPVHDEYYALVLLVPPRAR